MHFFHKMLQHKQSAVSEWNSEDFKRILDQNPSSANGDNGSTYKSRGLSGHKLKNQVKDCQLGKPTRSTLVRFPFMPHAYD